MRLLLKIKFPHEPFNALVRNGTAGKKMKAILDALKPEAAYFTEQEGHRGGIFIVNVDNPSKVPALAEPWFLTFNADCEFRVVMTPEELAKAGLEELGKKWA
ncbi:MAG TPA: panthothenate synthetase [Terriglobia bacterium]|nr:panthothenate synthetase [Terriglobia bacterium]